MSSIRRLLVVPILAALVAVIVAPASAASIDVPNFQSVWARTDQPVVSGQAHRTWMWGPTASTQALWEQYFESPGGQREVQYFDKTRMEITQPGGDQSSIWYVTNGLLAKELITGQMQLGDGSFVQHDPANVNVAGDETDPTGPTYATFNKLMGSAPVANNATINQTVDRAGNVGTDQNLGGYNVVAKDVGSPTHHDVASVFWDFMNSTGTVDENGSNVTDKLFPNAFYATGYPLTEAYWTNVLVGGVQKQVLVQVFERRVLTYTPSNDAGWKVEAGNVGLHYYTWRYTLLGGTPVPASSSKPVTNGSVPQFDHVYVIMMENKEFTSVVGNNDAPYLNQLMSQNGLATDYTGISHPSQPNYVALWSGSTNGVGDDNFHDITGATNIADQLEAAGKSWMVYAENYPVSQAGDSCYTDMTASNGEDGTGNYVRRHNPAMSFTSLSGNVQRCAQHVTDFTHFDPAAAEFNFIVPNLCDDMHDCPVASGDNWLKNWLGAHILNTNTWATTDSAVIITWDEGSTNTGGGGVIPTIVISKHTPKGFISAYAANHYTLLRTIQEAFGLGCLDQSCSNGDLAPFFAGTN